MLVDVTFKTRLVGVAPNTATTKEIADAMFRRLDVGVYETTHWNPDNFVTETLDQSELPSANTLESEMLWLESSGVCDSWEQLRDHRSYRHLWNHAQRFAVFLVEMRRDEQPDEGGWRWHKWGTYIGTQEPECEYLRDEPHIERVFTFSVYEVS